MNLDILEENKYISAVMASQKVGYDSDYIGQLCRLGKIPGKLVGRIWYVDLNSLINHKQNRQLGRRRKEETPAEHVVVKGLKRTPLNYQTDDQPLLPTLSKPFINEVSHREMPFTIRAAVLIFSTVIVLGVGSFFEYREGISLTIIENLMVPLDLIVEEHTGARASEYVALLVESIKEFTSLLASFY